MVTFSPAKGLGSVGLSARLFEITRLRELFERLHCPKWHCRAKRFPAMSCESQQRPLGSHPGPGRRCELLGKAAIGIWLRSIQGAQGCEHSEKDKRAVARMWRPWQARSLTVFAVGDLLAQPSHNSKRASRQT